MSARHPPNWVRVWSIFTSHLPNKHKVSSPLAKPLPWNWWFKKKNTDLIGKKSGQFRIIDGILLWFLSDKKNTWQGKCLGKKEVTCLDAFCENTVSQCIAFHSKMSSLNFRTLLSWWFRSPFGKMLVKVELPQKIGLKTVNNISNWNHSVFGVFRANKKMNKQQST